MVTVITAVSVREPSLTVYVKTRVPSKPSIGVYTTVVPLVEALPEAGVPTAITDNVWPPFGSVSLFKTSIVTGALFGVVAVSSAAFGG